ncbi:MAG: metallophosphoesterase [Acidilobaceae archaeon]
MLAVSDIHSPLYLALFRQALDRVRSENPCVFILAGDIVDRGKWEMGVPVVREIERVWRDTTILAVFGNEEYEETRPSLRRALERVLWLEDSYTTIKCEELTVGFVGTQGALDRLTRWQSRNAPWLAETYARRAAFVESAVRSLREVADRVVVVSHYALARANLAGEHPAIWPEMYSSRMEEAIARSKPDIAIHGHAHKGSELALVSGVPVYNVALPLTRKITVIDL